MGQIRVLVADPELRFRQGLLSILELERDMEPVGEAQSVREVIARTECAEPDVVILGLGPESETGPDGIRMLKERRPGVRVLVLCDNTGRKAVVEMLCAGADGYLPKNAGASVLVEAVRALHRCGAYLHPAAAKQVIRVVRGAGLADEGAEGETAAALAGAEEPARELVAAGAIRPGERATASFWPARGANGGAGAKPAASGSCSAGPDGQAGRPGVLAPLTRRECEVLQLMAEGRSNRDIAKTLFVSEKTVKNHVASILDKLVVRDRTQAVLVALKHGWVKLS
ncbi:MAG: response regulator transcription factor [Alicyclobacillaceae bacterium]|nr:response regulator transcription factor [Alicyclobacillaceae bacterium]